MDDRIGSFYETYPFTGETPYRNFSVWRELYKGLNNCTLLIAAADAQEGDNTQAKAEASFLRALYSWLIVETWGAESVDSTYDQIFEDLDYAVDVLPESQTTYGQVDKNAAVAFRARMYLTREEYSSALTDAQYIIASGAYSLEDTYTDVWDIDNRNNGEVIFAIDNTIQPDPLNLWYDQYVGDYFDYYYTGVELRDGGHQGHLMFEIRYENTGWGMVRDMENGRGFQRYCPTKYFIDLFDETLDERFYGSFKNVWYSNAEEAIPNWPAIVYVYGVETDVDAGLVGTPMFEVGDTAILFSKQPVPESEKYRLSESFYAWAIHPESGYLIFDINDMYEFDGSISFTINRQYCFPLTQKFKDLTRLDMIQMYSSRNAYIIRLAEMYLIAAEATMEQGDNTSAYN